jgi:hypothetical protein
MSTVKTVKYQVGTDGTSTNNFTIYQPDPPDGTMRVGNGNADAPTDVAQVNGDGFKFTSNIQIGTDANSANNFTFYQPASPDGTLRIGVGNADSPTEVAQFHSSGITMASGKEIANADGQTMTNTPAFSVRLGASNQTIAETTYTKIAFESVLFDTDNAFDDTTNYRFTVPVGKAGKYQFNIQARCDSGGNSNLLLAQLRLFKNGGAYSASYDYFANSYTRASSHNVTATMDLVEGDYVEGYVYINAVDNTGGLVTTGMYTEFSGHKLIT